MISKDKKLVLFGAKHTTLYIAHHLRLRGIHINLVTIPPPLAAKADVADYCNLLNYSELFETIYQAKSYSLKDGGDSKYILQLGCHVGLCIGWQRLIPGDILKILDLGVYGMHGSARDLPYGRGRSPMNWAIIEGREFFHTNLFRYHDGVDDGPVIGHSTFSILTNDNAKTLHYKNMLSMCSLIDAYIDDIFMENITPHPQSSSTPTFYPKREPADGQIDWRDSYANISRLARAVCKPFRGAFSYYEDLCVDISSCSPFYKDIETHPFVEFDAGIICAILSTTEFLVRCDDGVMICESSPDMLKLLRVGGRFSLDVSSSQRFSRNAYGFFDLG